MIAFRIARQTRSGVAGISICSIPNSASASTIALAVKAGRTITRIAVAFEAGRDGFWLARWLEARGVEAHVIHASSVAVSREHRRAKTDRLDTELLKRGFLGWLRGDGPPSEFGHVCTSLAFWRRSK
jgi:transposase